LKLFARRAPAGRDRPTAESPDLDHEVLLSRQPVLDERMRVVGYRIAYALRAGDRPLDEHPAVLFDTALSVIGLQELVGPSIAHLPISGQLLRPLGAPPGRPERMILRIRERDALDPALWPILELAVERGFALELDELAGPALEPALLELFSVVELDAAAWPPAAVAELASELRRRRRTPLAANLCDHGERDRAQQLGCQWFTGPFHGTPKLVPGRRLPTGELRRIASIVRLDPERTSLEEVVGAIEQDLGLSVRLLRYLNSAYLGMAATVSSVHDAVLRLGSRNVARWALTIAIAGAPGITRELAVMALTRARLCELLAASESELEGAEAFTVGLLSAVDAVLGCPLEEIVPELPLTSRVSSALLAHDGPAGEVLRAAIAYERGNFDDPALARRVSGQGGSFRSALGWAQETLPPPG
jgi:EAL and modified HD-GYP domain-containing signal transduction protein